MLKICDKDIRNKRKEKIKRLTEIRTDLKLERELR